jgi:WD40 repeat protein
MSNIYCIKSYQGSLLYNLGNDIVQRDNFTGLVQRVFRAHTDEVYSFLIKDEQILVSSGWDDMLILWDMLSGSIIRRIKAGTDMSIRSIDVWADRVFVAGGNGQVKGISLSTGRVRSVQCKLRSDQNSLLSLSRRSQLHKVF